MSRGSDGSRVVDLALGRMVAWCGVLSCLAAWARILEQTPLTSLWWTILASVPVCCLLAIAFAPRLPALVLMTLWGVVVVTVAAAQLLAFAGYHGDDVDELRPWIGGLGPIAVCMAALLVRPMWLALIIAVTLPFGLLLSGILFHGSVPDAVSTMTPIHLGNLAVLAIMIGARDRLQRLHDAEQGARRLEKRRAAAETRLDRQRDVARLVHDDVLSVLAAAARLRGPSRREVREAATSGLESLRGAIRSPYSGRVAIEPELSSADARAVLTRVVENISTDADLRIALRVGTVPSEVVDLSALALGEALRNSVTHAGASDPVISGVIGSDELSLVISDRGPGFDADAVDPERIGLRLSILDRMRGLPGGTARVRSSAEGTRIELAWHRARTHALDSGLSTPTARLAVGVVWATGIAHSMLLGLFPVPTPLIGIGCYLIALLGVVLVTAQRPGRLRPMEALGSTGCAIAMTLCVLAYADISDAPAGEIWLVTFASCLVALVSARGNTAAGGIGALLIVMLLSVWGVATHQSVDGIVAMATPTMLSQLVGITWFIGVSRITQRERGARSAAVGAAAATLASALAWWSTRRELLGILHTTQPALGALSAGISVDESFARELEIVEGAVRDRIRAPGLHHPAVADAVRRARARGVHVTLLGDEESAGERMPSALVHAVVSVVADDRAAAITIRERARGGARALTLVTERTDGEVERVELGVPDR